ncbi:benzodiazepine receptor binding [Homalodisca vitripennis]|nr:benzodiazepine receptor binding [Homalodisca vitripennis]
MRDRYDKHDLTVVVLAQLTLERQLNKSVLIGWNPPEMATSPPIDCYHVYVDGVLKVTVKATERTRALVEGVDSNRVSSF